MPNTYTCAVCGETYEQEDDATAREEFELLYPDEEIDDAELICDDCFKEFYAWMVEEREHGNNADN